MIVTLSLLLLAGERSLKVNNGLLGTILPVMKPNQGLLAVPNDPYLSIKNRIREHEDFRDKPYLDTLGNKTVGIGHKVLKGETIPTDTAGLLDLYDRDFTKALDNARSIVDENSISPEAFGVVVEMNFQMGKKGTLGFKKMLKALKNSDYKLAATELLDSKFAKQTPNRAKALAKVLNNE